MLNVLAKRREAQVVIAVALHAQSIVARWQDELVVVLIIAVRIMASAAG